MDTNKRPAGPVTEPPVENGDWRSQLQSDSRQRIVTKIMDTLKRHLPFSGQEGLQELKKIAMRFEEKIYTAASSQTDYLRKISLKMLTMETKSQNTLPNPLAPNSAGNSNKPPDSGVAHTQVQSQGQSLTVPLLANQSQVRPQLLQENIQNNLVSNGVQSSTSLPSAPPPASGLTQTSISNIVGQNPNLQSISGVSQNSAGSSIGPGIPSNMFANSQRHMQVRQQGVPQQQQQQQQQQQNNPHYLYQQQLHQLNRQKLQQGNLQHPLVQSQVQQQQQPNLLQSSQLQASQQSGMQTSNVMQSSLMQSSSLPSFPQNQPTSVQQSTQPLLQQHPQSVMRQQQQTQQASGIHQQQTPMMQQQLMGQQTNATNMQQNQLTGQQKSLGDMRQQQHRLLGQKNNLQNLQQQQQQQQLIAPQSNLSGMHQQQLGPQSNVSTLQQQPDMQTGQRLVHMMQQQKIPMQQSNPQNTTNMLSNQGQQLQLQQPQQQLMSQIQSQPTQLQQQLGLQQQSNPLQRDMQQSIQAQGQAGGSLLQQQSVTDQQKQLYQSQRLPADTSPTSLDSTAETGHANGGDWQEEVYQKIKTMKETYLPELNDMYQKIATKLQQHDSLPQQPKSDQLDKLKMFKTMLERIISFLQVSKNNILPGYKEKLGSYEKQIINFLATTTRPKKPMASGQLLQSHVQAMPQQQPQISQVQSHENPINMQMQAMVMQGSVPSMQQNIMSSMAQNHMSSVAQNNMSSMQHNMLSSLSGVSTSQQNMNLLQPGSNLDAGQGNVLNSSQQVPVVSMQQNPVSSSQQANINALSSQSGVAMLHPNNPLQANSNMLQLQHQHLKQQQHEHVLQSQQLKHRQIQQQLMQKQHMLQLHQQAKQQLPAQMQTHQMSQLHQMNDINELKLRQGVGVKSGAFQQHLAAGQRAAYSHQSMKPGSSPQLLQAPSPQLPQHSSPQIELQNMLSSLTKAGTPLQSANSPFVVPSPSTPSPVPGDFEKPSASTISSLSNAGHQQTTSAQASAPSLAIGTPGISASPLLAEFASPDGANGSGLTTFSGKPSAEEQPLERLIKAVKRMSSKALSASVTDIGSVVSMIDRIAGSAPGNGSRAAVGEDLVAMTHCRLQARNVVTHDGMAGTRKMRRYTSAFPLNIFSSAGSVSDSFKQLTGLEASELESTATSSVKRPRLEANHVLLEEIRDINHRLIDTVVDISDEDVDITTAATAAEGGGGTVVKCSYSAVALSPNLKSQYASAQMSPIQPLRLLVPTNYPNCSPILLDKFPAEVSKEYEDLSVKAKSRFSISLRSLCQPTSLEAIARTWDDCARAVICEHAQQRGGGSFSSKYGIWKDTLSAA